jgi:cold shock CspA family protein
MIYLLQHSLGKHFFQYLTTLAKKGDRVGHSSKTIEYYRSLEKACQKHLADYQDQPQMMLKVLGWTTRLMRYYKTTSQGESETLSEPKQSERQAEIEKASSSQELSEGQEIEATVAELRKGNKVTYEIAVTTQRLTEREPKKYKSLSEGQQVKLQILRLEEGKIKKVKCVDP